jgi:hypothetical protein
MQQRLFFPMRDAGANRPGLNLSDAIGPGGDPGWTTGATLIDTLPISPPLAQTWRVLSWAFTFNGAWIVNGARASYGKLGALWAGLLTGGESRTNGAPWVAPMLPLPVDLTMFQKVWDGAVDPMFPNAAQSLITAASGGASENLPSPIIVDSGKPLAFGVWLTPSLVANTILEIFNANVSIVYDDGMSGGGAQ